MCFLKIINFIYLYPVLSTYLSCMGLFSRNEFSEGQLGDFSAADERGSLTYLPTYHVFAAIMISVDFR